MVKRREELPEEALEDSGMGYWQHYGMTDLDSTQGITRCTARLKHGVGIYTEALLLFLVTKYSNKSESNLLFSKAYITRIYSPVPKRL